MKKPNLSKPLSYSFQIDAARADDFRLSQPKEDDSRYYFEAIGASLDPNNNYFQFTRKSLGQMRDGYKKGLPLSVNHDRRDGLGIGQTSAAEVSDGLLYVQAYIHKNINYRSGPFQTGQDYANAVADGYVKNVSVSAYSSEAVCSVCGNDWRDYRACQHWPGQDYTVGEGADKRVVTMIVVIKEAEPLELSLVQIGAERKASITRRASNFFFQDTDFVAENELEAAKKDHQPSSVDDETNQEGATTMDFEAKVRELEAEISALQADKSKAESECVNLNLTNANLETDKTTLTTRIETLERQNEAFDNRIKEMEKVETGHIEEIQSLKSEVEANRQLAEDGQHLRAGLEQEYVKQYGRLKGENFPQKEKDRKLEAAKQMTVEDLINMAKNYKEDADQLHPAGRQTTDGDPAEASPTDTDEYRPIGLSY